MHLCNLTFFRFAMSSFKLKYIGGKLGWTHRLNFARHFYTCFNNFNKASSTRIRFCFKTEFFSSIWPIVHTYLLKTVTGENASFQKRSLEWRFLKRLFAVLVWMNYCKMEVLENIISQFQIPVNAHASIKDDTILSYYYFFVWTGKND